MGIQLNAAILGDSSCLDTLHPTKEHNFEIGDGCKLASEQPWTLNSSPILVTTAGEAKPNLEISLIELANCHHCNVLWQPSCQLKTQFRPGELLWHVTVIWEMSCACRRLLRRERIFQVTFFFSNTCRSCRFLVMQGLLVGFLSVRWHTVFVFWLAFDLIPLSY